MNLCRYKPNRTTFFSEGRWSVLDACEEAPAPFISGQQLNITDPTITGHTFDGRSTSPDCSGVKYYGSSTFQRNTNVTLYGCREVNKYRLAYDQQGGNRKNTPASTGKQVVYGQMI